MKPITREAMKRAGITYQVLGQALGIAYTHINGVIRERLPMEQEGEFVCVLGHLTHLVTKERRKTFSEVVNWLE